MDNETYLVLATMIFIAGFVVSGLVLLFYSAVAPWYKTPAGRYIWGLELAIFLAMSVSVVRLVFGDFFLRKEIAIGTLALFLIAQTSVGIGIYRAQFKHFRHYLKEKCDKYVKAGKNDHHS